MGAPAPPLLQARALARGRARLRPGAAGRGRRIPAVLVTGASTGIGRATAERLARAGWTVYASVRVGGDAPPGTDELVFDVTDAAAIARAAEGVERLDGLVDNAGIAIAAPLEYLPPDELTRQLDVNVVGQLRVLQAFVPALRRARGRIVIVGSVAGRSALPFLGAYAMSKFALEAMADALRVELQPWGLHVAIVEPATIATPMWTKPQRSLDDFPPEAAERYGARLQRFAQLAAERSSAHAVSTDTVAKAIEHALTAPKPKTRYLIGPDAKRRAAVQLLPDRLRDRVITRFLFGS
jgi:NAD(P)-dependent dehydrogenase (short-subunit alcohol dehydrogenase family)